MKILHISSSMTGGAGIAATNLVEAQREYGIEAYLLSRDNSSLNYADTVEINFLSKLLSRINTFFSNMIARTEYSQLTVYSVGMKIDKEISKINPDVIHIHNWFNILSWKQVEELNSKYPVVFTLHDSRLLTGGCHFDLGCGKFNSGCVSCPAIKGPKKIISLSKASADDHIRQLRQYSVVSPSQWLLELGKSSEFFLKSHQAVQINNIVNARNVTSHYASKSQQRNIYFIAANLTAPVKGVSLLLNALDEDFCGKHNLRIVFVGEADSRFISQVKKHKYVQLSGRKSNPEVMKGTKFGDFLIVPSASENSPNVISEAQLTGLIVVASAVGGIPELVNDGYSGFLFQRTEESVRNSVMRAMDADLELIRRKASSVARERNNKREIVERHLQIYLALSQ